MTATVLVGAAGSFVPMVMLADFAPGDDGRNRIGSAVLAPGATVIGKLSTCGVWKSADEEASDDTVNGQDPLFAMESGKSRNLLGLAQNSPKFPVSAMTETAVGLPIVAVTLTATVRLTGSSLGTVRTAFAVPGPLGVNFTWNGKQEPAPTETGKPLDGGTALNAAEDDVIGRTVSGPPPVLQTLSVAVCTATPHESERLKAGW